MLTAAQWRFIAARLLSKTDKEAAEQIGIAAQTVANWKNEEPNFVEAYEAAFTDTVHVAQDLMRANLAKAAERLAEAMDAVEVVAVEVIGEEDEKGRKQYHRVEVPDWRAILNAIRLMFQSAGLLNQKIDLNADGKQLRIVIEDGDSEPTDNS